MSTSTQTIESKIAAADAAAAKAAAKADQLRAEAAEAEAAEQARKATAKAAFEADREHTFPTTYARPVREARQAFTNAVTTGGDYIAAWVTYQAAQAVARAELAIIETHARRRHDREQATLEARRRDWNERIRLHLDNVRHSGAHPDLAAINAEISEATGRQRRPADHSPLDTTDVGMSNFTSEADRFNDTDLVAAIGRTISGAVDAAVADHRAERAAAIAAL